MSWCMRTTIRLDEGLLKELKRFAAETGRTMTAIIEDALREVLARRSHPRTRTRVKLTVAGGRGPLPGVDLDHSASLLDVMDGPR